MEIEKNIPLPPENRGRKPKYPWREMEIGDSFFMNKPQRDAGSHAADTGRRTGMKFATRKEGEGARIWRIE